MKKTIAFSIDSIFLLLVSLCAFSQQGDHKIPAWVNDKGYWVAEKNQHTPRECTVRFYNNANTLVGTKEIAGTKLNLSRKKTKLLLNTWLNAELLQWSGTQKNRTGEMAKKQ